MNFQRVFLMSCNQPRKKDSLKYVERDCDGEN